MGWALDPRGTKAWPEQNAIFVPTPLWRHTSAYCSLKNSVREDRCRLRLSAASATARLRRRSANGLLRSTSIPERLLPDGQHSIAIQLRGESRVLQSFRYFVGNIPAAGQFVRCAGVVEQ